MGQISSQELMFESDQEGKLKRWRGAELPDGLIKVVAADSLTEHAPSTKATNVVRAAYKFAERVGSKARFTK